MAVPGVPLLRMLLIGTALCPVPALAETTWIDLGTITLPGTHPRGRGRGSAPPSSRPARP